MFLATKAIVLGIVLFLVSSAAGQEPITGKLDSGDRSTYYDLTLDGQFIKVDYVTGSAEILGAIDWTDGPMLPTRGWMFEEENRAVLFVMEPSAERGWWRRLYVYSLDGSVAEKTSLLADSRGHVAVLPASLSAFYVQYVDARQRDNFRGRRFEFNANDLYVRGSFTFPLRPENLHTIEPDSKYLYVASRPEPRIAVVDQNREKLVRTIDLNALGIKRSANAGLFVRAFSRGMVLVAEQEVKQDRTRLILLDIPSLTVRAQSNVLPFFTGRFWIGDNAGSGPRMIYCVARTIIRGQRQPTGTLFTLALQGDVIERTDVSTYDVESQIALRTPENGVTIAPKQDFDYVSRFALFGKVAPLLRSTFTRSDFGLIEKAAAELTRDLRAELDSGKAKRRKLVFREIEQE